MGKGVPPTIEGTYRVVDHRPRREPIFNNWRYAVPLATLLLLRLLWVLATRQQ
jgi:hypothetical protein